jgi:hypothetical protein
VHRTSIVFKGNFRAGFPEPRLTHHEIDVGDEVGEYLGTEVTLVSLKYEVHSACSNGTYFITIGYLHFHGPSGRFDMQTHPLYEGLADKTAGGTRINEHCGFCAIDYALQLERKVGIDICDRGVYGAGFVDVHVNWTRVLDRGSIRVC